MRLTALVRRLYETCPYRLSLEAAEVLEHFQWNDQLEDQSALADELADVLLYLLQIASVAEVDLEQAVLAKLERNYTRKWDSG